MDSLEIDGKEYISARKAAKEHGYVSDYIGQLIRAKKLEGKKVGRAWYVSKESLDFYVRTERTGYISEQISGKPVEEKTSKSIPAVVSNEATQDAPIGKKEESSVAGVPEKESATYELLRYMPDSDPELPEILETGVKSASEEGEQVHVRLLKDSAYGSNAEADEIRRKDEALAELAPRFERNAQEAHRSSVEAPIEESEATPAMETYFKDKSSLGEGIGRRLLVVTAFVLALIGVSFGVASVLATKEISYSKTSLSASLESINIGNPR